MLLNGESNFELSQEQMIKRMETMWNNKNGLCGPGSSPIATKEIRYWLPLIIDYFNIKTINDAGCGNRSWIQTLNLKNVNYQGYDLINTNNLDIINLDITTQPMRKCDLIICRDVLFHLSFDRIQNTIKLFKESGKFILTTYYDSKFNGNQNISSKNKFFKLCLLAEPFNFNYPILSFYENNQNRFMGLWNLSNL